MKFEIEDFYENLSGNSKFGYSLTKMLDTLHEDQSTYIFFTAVQNILKVNNTKGTYCYVSMATLII